MGHPLEEIFTNGCLILNYGLQCKIIFKAINMEKKQFKKKLKKTFTRERITKIIIVLSGLALVATSVLPYLLY